MKQIIPVYSFNKTSKTVTLTDFTTVRLDRLLIIANATTGDLIYSFADQSLNATVATNVFTLEFDTSAMANTDKLIVIYDTVSGDPDYQVSTVISVAAAGIAVVGNVASGSADSGNPVKVGGRYNSTLPTLTNGQRGDLQLGVSGSLNVTLFPQNGTSPINTSNGADGVTPGTGLVMLATNYIYNGSTSDRWRSDGTTGGGAVGGSVASAATDSGNPVKIGAVYKSSKPTFTDGQRGDLQMGTRGSLNVTVAGNDSASYLALTNPTDGQSSSPNAAAIVIGMQMSFNGTTWDRIRYDGTTGGVGVGGTVASGATDSGNPVKVGGRYNSTPPTITDGQRGDLQLNSRGGLIISGDSGAAADGATAVTIRGQGGISGPLYIAGGVFNGSTWDRQKSDGTTGGLGVGGTVASAATDSGNPIKIGGKAVSSLPTYTNGQRGDLAMSTNGALYTTLVAGTTATVVSQPQDAVSAQQSLYVAAALEIYNGSTFDRGRWDGVLGGLAVGGSVASGATDSGNPVKVGTKFNSSQPSFTNGQRADLQSGADGALMIGVHSSGNADAQGAANLITDRPSGQMRPLGVATYISNGTSFDRQRGNVELTVLASAARTATTNSSDQTNYNARGVHVLINVTATTTGSITPKIQGKDPVSGTYYDMLVGTLINTTGITALKLYPGIGVIANGAASDILPRTWRVAVTHTDATSITYSVGAAMIV